MFILLGDGTIRTYEVPSLELYHRVVAHPAPCFCVDVDPRGRLAKLYLQYLVLMDSLMPDYQGTLLSVAQTL
jgi:hypothetical protein